MPRPTQIRIMIVDDHPIVRQGLTGMINSERDMTIVSQAETGHQAIHLYKLHEPDVTLMDLRMPGMSGVEAIKLIHDEFPSSKFIVLTTYDGDEDIYNALSAGAKSYLLKNMFAEEILEAIRVVHAGLRRIPNEVSKRLAERLPNSRLTSREMEVLTLIVKGMSNKEIGVALSVTEATVKTHVINILGKMGVSDRTQAAIAALQRGLVHTY